LSVEESPSTLKKSKLSVEESPSTLKESTFSLKESSVMLATSRVAGTYTIQQYAPLDFVNELQKQQNRTGLVSGVTIASQFCNTDLATKDY
jgi:hypothetical protein